MHIYDFTIVIPVYNAQQHIRDCLTSLMAQTHGFENIEILMVNDGSTDNSGEICCAFAEKYKNVVCLSQENAGVSAARNLGIKSARGKYIFCLDSDDWLSDNAVAVMFAFFEEHYDEVDIVSCRIINYLNGIETPHPRNALIAQKRVYDLNKDLFVAQTNINVCVKNTGDDSILFDHTMTYEEDEERNTRVAMKKVAIGYCPDAVYYYRRHADSATKSEAHRVYSGYFDYYERVFKEYSDGGRVHPYIQATALYGFAWRFSGNMIFPDSLSEHEFAQRMRRFKELLGRIEDKVLVNSPFADNFLTMYLLRAKGSNLSFYNSTNGFAVCGDGTLCNIGSSFEIAVQTLRLGAKTLLVQGFTKSPCTEFYVPRLYYSVNGDAAAEMQLHASMRGSINRRIKTQTIYEFEFEVPYSDDTSVSFLCEIAGSPISVNIVFCDRSPINRHRNHFLRDGFRIRYIARPAALIIEKISPIARLKAHFRMEKKNLSVGKKMFILRVMTLLLPKRRIWLYSDRGDLTDNAAIQFLHDCKKKDGILRYYVVQPGPDGEPMKLPGMEKQRLLTLGSLKHKVLFLRCEKILASFLSWSIVSPFPEKALSLYSDLLRYELVYLQHGVLHAHLPLMYAKECCSADRIVVSSAFEKQNFINNYGYAAADIIESGMPRYDTIDCDKPSKNTILFCPSWRSNLIGGLVNNEREPKREEFLASAFYSNLMNFLNSPELAALLEEYDLYLDYRNHPIFRVYDPLIHADSPRVRILSGEYALDEYRLMITDFSSIVFDFVYLGRPIVYFVPDYALFEEGVTHNYNALDLPFKEGFGEFTQTAEELLTALSNLVRNGFVPEEMYAERMEKFFLHKDNNQTDRLYEALMLDKDC